MCKVQGYVYEGRKCKEINCENEVKRWGIVENVSNVLSDVNLNFTQHIS